MITANNETLDGLCAHFLLDDETELVAGGGPIGAIVGGVVGGVLGFLAGEPALGAIAGAAVGEVVIPF
jgi:uncharacterized protein YcfJ